MKNIKFIIFLVVLLSLMTACNKPASEAEAFSFSGENEEIKISNGSIMVTDEADEFIGGDLSFNNEEMTDVKEYESIFFYEKDGEQIEIITDASIVEGEEVSPELIKISGKNLFDHKDLDLVKKSLSYSLSGKLMTGEDFNYLIPLDVEETE